jgi:hypothetical protein
MHKLIFILPLLIAATMQAQFKADNVKYKTVYPEDLCKTYSPAKAICFLMFAAPENLMILHRRRA